MSTSNPYPGTAYVAANPFDLQAINRQIDAALSTVKAEDHGNIFIQAKPGSVSAGLIVKGPTVGPLHTSGLATITKPLSGGNLDWLVAIRGSFAVDVPRPRFAAVREWLAEFSGWAQVLSGRNSLLLAIWRAALLASGFDVKLIG
jgi:hypothetical protein